VDLRDAAGSCTLPNTPLAIQEIHFLTDYQVPICACRARALSDFVAQDGSPVAYSCLVDSGAPLCVIPYSLWHDRNLDWTPLGTVLTQNGSVVPNALKWHGIDCYLGSTRVYLVNPTTRTQAGPYLVIGKFAQGRQSNVELEVTSLLGLNFLLDNRNNLALSGVTGQLTGLFS
jgi:hypothetical protein